VASRWKQGLSSYSNPRIASPVDVSKSRFIGTAKDNQFLMYDVVSQTASRLEQLFEN